MRIIIVSLLFFTTITNAQNFTWNGVFTQGLFHTDDNNIYGKSEDDVSFDFTEFSLNGNYNFPNNIRVAGQAIYRHAGATFDGINIDYLLFDMQLFRKEQLLSGLRFGRIKQVYGLFNDARDIAFTRPSIFLSGLYQDTLIRDTVVSSDGISFYSSYFSKFGEWEFEINYGETPDENLSNLVNFFGNGFDPDALKYLFYRLKFQTLDANLLVGFGGGVTDSFGGSIPLNINQLIPSLPFSVDPVSLDFDLDSPSRFFFIQYLFRDWLFTAEYSLYKNKSNDRALSGNATTLAILPPNFLDLIPGIDVATEPYYIQIDKVINKKWSMYIRHDSWVIDTNDRSGNSFEASGQGLAHTRFTRMTGIGLEYSPEKNVMVRAEYHHVIGTSVLNPVENQGSSFNSSKYWNIVAASFSYRF